MKVYLDASLLVALFTNDALTARAEKFLRARAPLLIVSDFAAAEFASAVARRARMGELKPYEARSAFADFDSWTARATERIRIEPADVAGADAFLRRLDLSLRAPDAVNIAIAQRAGAELATFDDKMAKGARALKTSVSAI